MALTAGLGLLVEPYREHWSRVVRHILPGGDRIVAERPFNERMHTDRTDWQVPNDLTCLQRVQPDQNRGGASLVVRGDDIRATLAQRCPEHLAALSAAVPWKMA